MGPCVSPTSANHRNSLSSPPTQKIWRSNPQLSQLQVSILKLIYFDLSSRSPTATIALQDFLLFFHKNGYWGNRLFKQFARNHSQSQLSEEEFVNGMGIIYKSGEKEKIMLLFKYFSNGQQGVGFNSFLTMLYNYPKEDLKQILNDKAFIEYELSKRLGYGDTLRAQSSAKVTRMNSNMMLRHHISMGGSQLTKAAINRNRSDDRQRQVRRKLTKEKHGLESLVGGEIISNLTAKNIVKEQVLNLQAGGEKLEIKTINIQQVVKKFAYSVFDEAEVDPEKGRLDFNQFFNWISNHPTLYQNYYSGFHADVWQANPKTKHPRYLTAPSDKVDIVKTTLPAPSPPDHYVFCQIFLFHSILVICPERKLLKPAAVVCLEGLSVNQIMEDGQGFGVEMTHRDEVYPPRKIFFKDQRMLTEWMEYFRFCKGESVRQKYRFGQKIGTGKFSIVYKGESLHNTSQVAIKQIVTLLLDDQAKQLIAY